MYIFTSMSTLASLWKIRQLFKNTWPSILPVTSHHIMSQHLFMLFTINSSYISSHKHNMLINKWIMNIDIDHPLWCWLMSCTALRLPTRDLFVSKTDDSTPRKCQRWCCSRGPLGLYIVCILFILFWSFKYFIIIPYFVSCQQSHKFNSMQIIVFILFNTCYNL